MQLPVETTKEPRVIHVRHQEARKLFGFAVGFEQQALYETMGGPAPSRIPDRTTAHIGAEYRLVNKEESVVENLFLNGMADVQTFILGIMEHHPRIGFDRAAEIAQHERTISALAIIARQKQARSSIILGSPGDAYMLDQSGEAIEVEDSIRPAHVNGCPAIELVDGYTEPWPIFTRFAPWAAKLALISYFDHK